MFADAVLENDHDIEAWVQQMIARNGYAQLSVHTSDDGVPGYAFTIGLEASRKMPELFCMGLAPDNVSRLFVLCIEGQESGTCDLSAGEQDVDSLVQGFVLRFRRVGPAMRAKLNAARPERDADLSDILQLVLPDNDGLFPGDPGCDPNIVAAQDIDRLLATATN